MGWLLGDEQTNEAQLVDSTGHVNNNVIIQEAKDTHQQAILSEKLVYGTYILIALEIVKLAICSYNMRRQVKK